MIEHVFALGALILGQSTFDCAAPAEPTLVAPVVLGNGTPGSVSSAQLQSALNTGGDIQLNIGSGTLNVASTLNVTRGATLDLNGAALSGQNARRVIEVTNPQNLTYTFNLMNGSVINGLSGGSGAGLLKSSNGEIWQAVTIRLFDMEFRDNDAIQVEQDGGGGGVYVIGARAIEVIDSVFDNNTGSNGGALYSLGSESVNVFDTQFTNNHATGNGGNPGNGGNGGAIGVDGGERFINLCRVGMEDNEANAFGAGLFTVGYDMTSYVRIVDSVIARNNSSGSSQHTGGVYFQGGQLEVRRSLFDSNQARAFPGLSIFDHNEAATVSTGVVSDSTFTGNLARNSLGGGITISATGGFVFQNLTIAHNRAPCDVCFLSGLNNSADAVITLRNSLFFDNTGGNAFNPWAIRHTVSGSNNLQWPEVRPDSFGQTEVPATNDSQFVDPQILALANNGGPSRTHGLALSSPARDAGTATGTSSADQRGLPRVDAPDIGAFEDQKDTIFANSFESP